MKALTWIAYICWGLAAIGVVLAIGDENPIFLVLAGSLAISGVLFSAFERVITLLTEIRGALVEATEAPKQTPIETNEAAPDETPLVTRTVEEISADLKRLKEKTH
ncbi:hypothetical protein MHM39_14845 [Phaeobacter sp. CNT1-3]|nr:hypothetical protein [Phaeobacter sp. CNT1-3]